MKKEQLKEYRKEYYQQNKKKEYEKQREWQTKNSKKFSKLVQDSRRRRVERLRTEGCKNAWNVVINGVEPKYYK